jgi:nickel-type superoxide dismutase maturation protease
LLYLRRIAGESMLPTLRPGQVILALAHRRPKRGDIVVARHGGLDKVKRIHAHQDGRVFLVGDNAAESTDSRNFGWIPTTAVLAIVVWPRY